MNRNNHIQRLREETFDLCIIGAGASGAGCALDASLRGLRTALIDQSDFAAQTSSKSTKLVHGGVRYLEQAVMNFDFAQLRQVRHGLRERHFVLANAPHLAHPLGLVTPVFSWWEGVYFSIGLKLYDWFAAHADDLPKSRLLSRKKALQMMPGLNPAIHSAVLYYDGQLDDARYALALVQSAEDAGAAVSNYVKVIDFQKDSTGKIESAVVQDSINGHTFSIRAKAFLNCTGAGADAVRLMANPDQERRIQPSKGVHLVIPNVLQSEAAMLIPKTKDGRVIFAVPFEGMLLLGTTDDPYGDPQKEPVLEATETDFLLETLQPFLKDKVHKQDLRAGFGGLRPLVLPRIDPTGSIKTKTMLRDHEVEFDPRSGLFSLLGGKWTTYRLMAKDAVNAVCTALGNKITCTTEQYLLHGAKGWHNRLAEELQARFGLDKAVCIHLSMKYGAFAHDVAQLCQENKEWKERILPAYPFVKGEVVYAARVEMACTVRDFLARRVRLEITNWEHAIEATPAVAKLLQEELNWSSEKTEEEISAYQALLRRFLAMKG